MVVAHAWSTCSHTLLACRKHLTEVLLGQMTAAADSSSTKLTMAFLRRVAKDPAVLIRTPTMPWTVDAGTSQPTQSAPAKTPNMPQAADSEDPQPSQSPVLPGFCQHKAGVLCALWELCRKLPIYIQC